MEYRRLGRCGLKVSEFCLGTMTFGQSTGEAEAIRMVHAALDAGVNFFDTADTYTGGQSEAILGKALRGRRREAVVATKVFNPVGGGPNDSGTSRVHIMSAIEDSLKRLDTDHVDLYYAHHVDVQVPMEEMLGAFDDLVHQGKVRYIACSNYEAWRLSEALWMSEAHNLSRFECYQPQYNLVVRDVEHGPVPLCRQKGVGIAAFSPMAGGFLTGKYKPGERVIRGTRSEDRSDPFFAVCFAPNADETLSLLLRIADELDRDPAQVAIRWTVQRPGITSAIVGARNMEQLSCNLGSMGWKLTDASMARLNDVSELPPRYPESTEWKMAARRNDAVGVRGRKG